MYSMEKVDEEKSVISWFFNFTGIGGLSQFNATDWTLSKIIWALLFSVGLILTLISAYMVIDDYR